MKSIDDIIKKEIKNTFLNEGPSDELESSPLEKLDNALKSLQSQDVAFEAIFAPYVILKDIFKLAVTGLKIILNDVVFVIKNTLAIRPSSWKLAREAHDKRQAKLNKEWEAGLKATGADSSAASLLTFLALPGPMISASLIDQGFKTVASVNHALVDSGIRLPLVGLLPGATPPDEIDMDAEALKKKKRGELSTKDAVKFALMKLFFAHHAPSGKILAEKKEEKPKSIKVTPAAVTKSLKDIGIFNKTQNDLQDFMDAKLKAVQNFFESENLVEKTAGITKILKASSPEALVEVAKTISDDDMSKLINDYIEKFNKAAEKIANNKDFQKTYLKTQDKKDSEAQAKLTNADKAGLKKEAVNQVFAKTHPQFKKALEESLAAYVRWIFESVESIYPVQEKALANLAVKKSVDKKDQILAQIINNISG